MLRTRKNKRYNEEAIDEDDEGGRRYNLKDKISSKRFETLTDLQELPGDEVTLKLIQRNGFDKPILVTAPAGLDLTAPPDGFVVRDVGKLVGYDRLIDVMDVRTQKNIEMTMREWCRYYESRNRDRLLNVISLEFSHTDLDDLVDSPRIIKQLDWVDLVWPKFLKESQTESTNKIDNMKYPKVQKYCLMSVKGSYTDFHIDFGGTSVWYHIIRGKKIFWMVPPTELSLQTFEEWTLSGMQQDVFFGDTVEQCFRVELSAGNTFFIPSGWIHAVYTVEDSLVFGGNFLHSFGIENQLKVSRIEDATKVPLKFRYPFYTEMLWYVVQHYVHCLTGKSHMHSSGKNSSTTTPEKSAPPPKATMKNNKSSTNVTVDDSATESEQDDCDKTNKERNKRAVSPLPAPKRKRGRPRKKEPVEPSESPTPHPPSALPPPKRKRGRPRKKEPVEPSESPTPSPPSALPPPKRKRGRPPKQKQPVKPPTDDEEDESTEIEASDDEDKKPAKTNTCRMTKNSLLRLQYEIDEPQSATKGGDRQVSVATSMDKSSKVAEPNKDDICSKVQPTAKTDQSGELPTGNLIKNELTANNSALPNEESAQPNGWSTSHVGASKVIWSNLDSEPKEPARIHITKYEVNGLKILVKYLSKLSGTKKHMPCLIRNAKSLLDDCKKVIAEHENDDPELATTGIPITPDLLNVKTSDMNQLIGQYFKPQTVTNGDAANNNSPYTTKSDSSTLTMQQRLKYNQTAQFDQIKVEDKKSSSAVTDNASPTKSSHRDIKCASLNKKSTISSRGGNATSNNSATNQSKSSPSKPLSNKQYTSKSTKSNDKSGANSLAMPDSFASLIAATSNAKGVFNVSSADVTSSLFGPSSPNKSIPGDKDAGLNQPDSLKPISIDISKLYAYDETSPPGSHKDNNSPKTPKSPEPPKISPTKRFITPSQNRIQPKERLIFASAPYVSPVFASEQSRQQQQSHSWQSSTPLHGAGPQQHDRDHHQQQQPQKSNSSQPQQQHQSPKISTATQLSPARSAPTQTSSNRSTSDQPIKRPAIEQQSQVKHQQAPNNEIVKNDAPKPKSTSSDQTLESSSNPARGPEVPPVVAIPNSHPMKQEPPRSTVASGLEYKEPKLDAGISMRGSSSQPIVIEDTSNAASDVETVKQPQKEPRGPPKKSKEARRVLESEHQVPSSPTEQTSVIKANTVHDIPVVLQSTVAPIIQPIMTTSVRAASPEKPTLQQNDKSSKPKAKRVKNSKDLTNNGNSSSSSSNATAQPNADQQRPSIIPGFVAAPINSSTAQSIIRPMKPGQQQYLISRPMMYNGMPNYPTSYMQHMVPASMPVFTAPMPNAMGMHNMQPGARIVWARPQAMPVVTTSSPANTPPTTTMSDSTTTTTKSKKQTPKSTATMPNNMHVAPPDNAALLSLATTALSTAPLPTTPTLSTYGASHLGGAFMANPMFAPQHYFNPYLQPMSMMHFAPRGPNHMPAMMAAGQIRPSGIPASQSHHHPTTRQLLVPVSTQPGQPGQPGQPRYLITQPGFMMPQAQAAHMFTGQQFPQGMPYAAFQSPVAATGTAKESSKMKKVKTR